MTVSKPPRSNLVLFLAVLLAMAAAAEADWPMYRHDNARSGCTSEKLQTPLQLCWVYASAHPPRPAWSGPAQRPREGFLQRHRVIFDDAFQVAADARQVYFGSSSDNKVYALDAKTGSVRWEFVTEGPVRLAPTVWRAKLYVGSDDGKVYCLDARTGRELWTFNAAPANDRVLGNGRLVSLWPVRTGVLVEDDVAYFGAGVFPAEGLRLYAVNAKNGKLIWKNDSFGYYGNGSISPQGYILLSKDKVFVPSSRTVPAAFSRRNCAGVG